MDMAISETTSAAFLGKWKHLVSTTNWEKGAIIVAWREAMAAADAQNSDYTDEAWSRRVANVTPQHVGRLRRVHERFSERRESFGRLYWSHFQAAIDWDDAEMWLEGALQNGWSVSEMRQTRMETLGRLTRETSAQTEIGDDDMIDEDAETMEAASPPAQVGTDKTESDAVFRGAGEEALSSGEEGTDEADSIDGRETTGVEGRRTSDRAAPQQPFANLPSLPADVIEVFEAFKLCILRHRVDGWRELARGDLIRALDSLKELALAPADD